MGGSLGPAWSWVLSRGASAVAWLWLAGLRPAVRFARIFLGVLPRGSRGSRATSFRIRRDLRRPRLDGGLDLEGALQVAREGRDLLALRALARAWVLLLRGGIVGFVRRQSY